MITKEDINKNDLTVGPIKEIGAVPYMGSLVEGRVVAKDRSSLFVDLGPQGTGIIYGREFYGVKNIIKNLNIGDKIFAKIVELENDDGYRELSLMDATKEMGWKKLEAMKERDEVVKVKITGVNKGGLLTDIDGMPAFLPVSQLSAENYPRITDSDKQKILKELQKFIGKTLEVKILDLLAGENKLILSEKAKSEQILKKVLENYKEGDIIEGQITGVANFGVFIKFPLSSIKSSSEEGTSEDKLENGLEGLIHISELDWQLVQNPAEIVSVGDIVKAQIIDIKNNQVFLSLKRLKENPWEEVEKKYKKEDVVNGKVISFSTFGAFIEVLPQIRGLCHLSEFSSQKEMEESLKIDKNYNFEILSIEPKEHRMSLKLVK